MEETDMKVFRKLEYKNLNKNSDYETKSNEMVKVKDKQMNVSTFPYIPTLYTRPSLHHDHVLHGTRISFHLHSFEFESLMRYGFVGIAVARRSSSNSK